jgi:hypothetical protein
VGGATAGSPHIPVSHALVRLRATLAFAVLKPTEPELVMLHRWLDTWRGLGDVVDGMRRQGFKLGLEDFGERWIAAFYRGSGGAEGLKAVGVAQDTTPWAAVQRAAWDAVK